MMIDHCFIRSLNDYFINVYYMIGHIETDCFLFACEFCSFFYVRFLELVEELVAKYFVYITCFFINHHHFFVSFEMRFSHDFKVKCFNSLYFSSLK